MAVVADPGGAAVRLWQAQQHRGAALIREPGAMSWCELQTGAPDRAAAFLQALLGTDSRVSEAGDGPPTR